MGKNRKIKTLEQENGGKLETAPASVLACEYLQQKDHLRTNKDKQSTIADISSSLECSPKKTKKKQKRKHLSEQEVENDCPIEQSTEGQELGEQPTPKKTKKDKTKEVNKANDSKTPSSKEKSDNLPTRRKKKNLDMLKENTAEKRKETEEGGLTVEAETQSTEERKTTKRKDKQSKDKGRNSLGKRSKNAESVFSTHETQTDIKEEDGEIKESLPIDESLLNQLKEFIPDIKSKESVNVSKMIKYDLPRFKEFKLKGISLNQGRFTAEENARLRQNVRDFMALTAIDSASKLFFTHRFKHEQKDLKKLKGTYRFFERIAEGIPRSCYYIYARGRRMFDEQNHQGEFTKEELCTLNKLHTLHGNNWKKISELTGRSALSLEKRYHQQGDKEGPWSQKEVQRLLRAVRDHIMCQIPGGANSYGSIRVMKETLYKRLPWQKIARKVKTRSWSQCREKWMGILAVKMSFGAVFTEKKSLDVQVKLIKGMYELDIDDAAHVDWEDLTALIGDVPPAYVQKKWHKLKVCHVPVWQSKCFADIVDFLYEKVLPHLEEKLMSLKDLDETQHNENEESYSLSDIFTDINEDENVDDDAEDK
ncbi:transcription termination factor 1-like [Clarias gariepinus]|uniref:transcription termination factor 1-like n=1 Tax=Clarias gariepinus TaxID=13013 RepID=UPI00234DDCB1|nr:transcription termination factor 1-like [Clarias gariepinus]